MPGSSLEVADIFRAHGAVWRAANAPSHRLQANDCRAMGHISLNQFKVMSAIERCRTSALGGHVARCADCAHEHIAYNSCRNRHCPKCQAAAAKTWLAAREAELLPVRYFHLVFTLPKPIADIAHQNKREIYNLLMRASADTVIKIAADPKHLGARAGMISVLHTWGSAMTHHPHIHMIVPGGGLSTDGSKWISSRKNFFLSVHVLSRLYRRLILEGLAKLHKAGKLQFFGNHAGLIDRNTFDDFLQPLRKVDWVVIVPEARLRHDAKPPFGGPEAVLAYLSRYTHRVAISNSRLISADTNTIAFQWKDYRVKSADRRSVMRLSTSELLRRFLIHVLPDRFHRIRHYGLLASAQRKANIAKARTLLGAQTAKQDDPPVAEVTPLTLREPCPDCGGQMRIIETFQRGQKPHSRAPPRKATA